MSPIAHMAHHFFKKPFEVVTIAGYRYTVTLQEVLSWFTGKWWWIFVFCVQIILIMLMPHNQIYELTFAQRLVFWPLTTLAYVTIYLLCIYVGARYAFHRPGSQYYTPIGMVVATVICTTVSSYYLGHINGMPADFSMFKWMEILFNMVWASIFEAFHFAFIVPLLRRRRLQQQHDWERFD